MSSHHVVRENQEPALVVENFHTLSNDHLGQILEWSPTIITNLENLDFFLSEGIKVDVVFGTETDFYPIQEEIKFITIKKSFLEDALEYLITSKHKAVNILADSKFDDILSYSSQLNLVLFCTGIRFVSVRNMYEKWKRKGDRMYVDPAIIKSFTGLRFLGNQDFEVEQDGFVRLEFNTDKFVFIGEEF